MNDHVLNAVETIFLMEDYFQSRESSVDFVIKRSIALLASRFIWLDITFLPLGYL